MQQCVFSCSLGYDKGRHTISPLTRRELRLLSRTFFFLTDTQTMEGSRLQKAEKFYSLKPWKILNSSLGPFGAIDNPRPLKCQAQNKISQVYNDIRNNIFGTCKLLLASQTEKGALSSYTEGIWGNLGPQEKLVPHDCGRCFVPPLVSPCFPVPWLLSLSFCCHHQLCPQAFHT